MSVIHVLVREARDLPNLDKKGLTDAYVTIDAAGAKKQKTKVVKDSLNPRWEESFTLSPGSATEVVFKVYDDDPLKDEAVGQASLPLSKTPFEDWLQLTNPKKGTPAGYLLVRVDDGTGAGAGSAYGAGAVAPHKHSDHDRHNDRRRDDRDRHDRHGRNDRYDRHDRYDRYDRHDRYDRYDRDRYERDRDRYEPRQRYGYDAPNKYDRMYSRFEQKQYGGRSPPRRYGAYDDFMVPPPRRHDDFWDYDPYRGAHYGPPLVTGYPGSRLAPSYGGSVGRAPAAYLDSPVRYHGGYYTGGARYNDFRAPPVAAAPFSPSMGFGPYGSPYRAPPRVMEYDLPPVGSSYFRPM